MVAWADGRVDNGERTAVLSAADEAGLSKHEVSYQVLEQWLTDPPPAEMLIKWKAYIEALSVTLNEAFTLPCHMICIPNRLLMGGVMRKHVSMHVVLGRRLRALFDAPVLPAPVRRTIGEGVQELEAAAGCHQGCTS